jgi:hypothetical protein
LPKAGLDLLAAVEREDGGRFGLEYLAEGKIEVLLETHLDEDVGLGGAMTEQVTEGDCVFKDFELEDGRGTGELLEGTTNGRIDPVLIDIGFGTIKVAKRWEVEIVMVI